MHAYVSTRAGQRRHTGAPLAPPLNCVIYLTADAGSVSALRRLAAGVCGEALEFIRIQACAEHGRMRVWMCVAREVVDRVLEAMRHALPDVRVGRLTTVGVLS
ncbi:MAG TPA: hypothetical protein VFG03_17625 [Telluria sp.]|nr:hypothetical protein [Telluria sp.]